MPEPAHSHSQSSLQSVRAMWRYLSRYQFAGVAFGAPGTCKQHTPQITAICGGAHYWRKARLQTSCPPANSTAVRKTLFHTAQRGRNCCLASVPRVAGALFTAKHTTMSQSSTSAAYLAMPLHADGYRQTCRIVAKLPRSADITRPAQTEMIPLRVGSHERTQNGGQFIPRAETCKQSFRGAVVVQHTCAQVMLTGVVGGGSQTARRSHLSSHVTVGLEAQQSNQRGHRRGDRRLQRYQQVCQSLATGGGSPPRHSCGLTASEPAARLSVRESSTKENVKSGDVA